MPMPSASDFHAISWHPASVGPNCEATRPDTASTCRDEETCAMVNPLAALRQSKLRIDKVENVSVPPNTERTLCNRTGPGVVVSLWRALGGGAAPAWAGRLGVSYDGPPTATIDIDMGTLLATHWGAGSANTSHSCEHVHVEINSGNYDTAFLLSFPIPFGTRIRIAYFNINAGQTATIYSMVTYSLTLTDEANGQRLRYKAARSATQKPPRPASSPTPPAQSPVGRDRSSTTPTSEESGPPTCPGAQLLHHRRRRG